METIKGGEFLIKEIKSEDIFVSEEFSEEQKRKMVCMRITAATLLTTESMKTQTWLLDASMPFYGKTGESLRT